MSLSLCIAVTKLRSRKVSQLSGSLHTLEASAHVRGGVLAVFKLLETVWHYPLTFLRPHKLYRINLHEGFKQRVDSMKAHLLLRGRQPLTRSHRRHAVSGFFATGSGPGPMQTRQCGTSVQACRIIEETLTPSRNAKSSACPSWEWIIKVAAHRPSCCALQSCKGNSTWGLPYFSRRRSRQGPSNSAQPIMHSLRDGLRRIFQRHWR